MSRELISNAARLGRYSLLNRATATHIRRASQHLSGCRICDPIVSDNATIDEVAAQRCPIGKDLLVEWADLTVSAHVQRTQNPEGICLNWPDGSSYHIAFSDPPPRLN